MQRTVCLALIVFVPSLQADGPWPSFRGGSQAGVAEGATLPEKWSTTENVVWKAEIPGRGWSSPIVWGDRVYVTAAVAEEKLREPQKGLYINDLNGKTPPGDFRWLVCCLDFKTGKSLWQTEVHQGKAPGPIHLKNTFATETPVTDGERIYAAFGNIGVFALDRDGKVLWKKPAPAVKTRMGWGPAASPVLHKDRLFIVNDNDEKSYVLALDAKSGNEVWRMERQEKSNWATPFVWENDKRTELVTPGTGKVRSYSLDGELLWELSGMSIITIPTPSARHGLLFVSSGYVIDRLKPVYAIKPGASGDITLPRDETSSKDIVWTQKLAGPYHPSPLVYGDYLYVLLDRGMISCYEAKTGKMIYEKQRLPGGAFTASPWGYNSKVFCLSEDGDTYVVQAGAEFKLLAKNSLDEMSMATPAIANGSLVVRTMGKVYRIEKK